MTKIIRTISLTDVQYDKLHKDVSNIEVVTDMVAKVLQKVIEDYVHNRRIAFDVARQIAEATSEEDVVINWVTRCIEVHPLTKDWKDVLD